MGSRDTEGFGSAGHDLRSRRTPVLQAPVMDPGLRRDDDGGCRLPRLQEAFFPRRRQHRPMDYYVYLLANRKQGALYAGVTNDLLRRIHEHREGLAESFTRQYGIKTLVWFEATPSIEAAITREKQLKNWKRAWKIALIERENRDWRDLYPGLLG